MSKKNSNIKAEDTGTGKQIAMVIDLNKCIGCQTCTVACKQLWTNDPGMEYMWWNIVNTVPGEGTPKGWEEMGGGWKEGELVYGKRPSDEDFGKAWDFNFDEVFYKGNKQKEHLRPKGDRPKWGPNWDEDQGDGEFPNSYYFYLPRLCNHCKKPACLAACPVKAIYKREEDGVVLIDDTKCKGTRMCHRACPYKRIYFNQEKNVSQKCVSCFPRLEKNVAPACVRQCPGRARHFGYLGDKQGQIYKLVSKWKVAMPLHEEFGTEPNVYYIPPILPMTLTPDGIIDETKARVPLNYLKKLFGGNVEVALETIKSERGKKEGSELMDILISRKWHDMMNPFHESPIKDS